MYIHHVNGVQLSIPFSNEDTIAEDMRNLLGVNPVQGKSIIEDLDVRSTVHSMACSRVPCIQNFIL